MSNLKFSFLVLVALTIFTTPAKTQTGESPVSYMSEVFTAIGHSKNNTWQYLKAITRGKGAKKVESKRQNLLQELKSSKLEIQRIGSYNSYDSLKIAAVNYLNLSYVVLKEDFDEILDMEDIAEQSYDLMEAYLLAKEKASDKLHNSYSEVVLAQNAFANKFNITLVDGDSDRTTEKIKEANETLKYYNKLYLIFFKSYKQEVYVLDAMQRNDINAFEQNTSTLELYASEGLEKAINLYSFRGDLKLKIELQRVLRFYKNEAEKDFPMIMDFFIKKDNFEKLNETFEQIKSRDRTQQDVDEFNKAVNEYNAAAKTVNSVTESNNKNRNKALALWNKSVEEFFK